MGLKQEADRKNEAQIKPITKLHHVSTVPRLGSISKQEWLHEAPIRVKPRPNLEWRPRAKPVHSTDNPTPSNPSNSDHGMVLLTENALTDHSIDPLVALAGSSGDIIVCTWGTSSNWMLELRDGRRLTIPLSLIC